jgi:hypothetical protein
MDYKGDKMKRLILCTIAFVLLSSVVTYAAGYGVLRPYSSADGKFAPGHDNTLPATCIKSDVFIDDNATSGCVFYVCESTNTWVAQGCNEEEDAFVIVCTSGDILGTDCGANSNLCQGYIVEIASGTVGLPPVETCHMGCVKATTAATIHIDPNINDRFKLDGIVLGDGDKLSSTGTLDETICFYADSAAGYTTLFNPHGFTDGN